MKCPEDYLLWLQSMYVHFGQKWAKLLHGPMWSSGSGTKSRRIEEVCFVTISTQPVLSDGHVYHAILTQL